MSKKSRFGECFDEQYGKRPQTLLKSASQHLYLIFWSLGMKLCLKKSLLLSCQIFGLLVNTLAADERYPAFNRDNLTNTNLDAIISEKKLFLSFLLHFLKLE